MPAAEDREQTTNHHTQQNKPAPAHSQPPTTLTAIKTAPARSLTCRTTRQAGTQTHTHRKQTKHKHTQQNNKETTTSRHKHKARPEGRHQPPLRQTDKQTDSHRHTGDTGHNTSTNHKTRDKAKRHADRQPQTHRRHTTQHEHTPNKPRRQTPANTPSRHASSRGQRTNNKPPHTTKQTSTSTQPATNNLDCDQDSTSQKSDLQDNKTSRHTDTYTQEANKAEAPHTHTTKQQGDNHQQTQAQTKPEGRPAARETGQTPVCLCACVPVCPQAVAHPSTNRALRRLTSEDKRDPVHLTRDGRQQKAAFHCHVCF